ncbi:MAG: reprolysin-like metallopeptidase, partial [Bacteroidota bacterium]
MKNYFLLVGLLLVCTFLSTQPSFIPYLPTTAELGRSDRLIMPRQASYAEVDAEELKNYLHSAPTQIDFATNDLPDFFLEVPTPSGEYARFKIVSYDMLEPELQSKFPKIINLLGIDVDVPTRRIRLDWTYRGFHASVIGDPAGRWYIDPLFRDDLHYYQSYYTDDYPFPADRDHSCSLINALSNPDKSPFGGHKLLDDCQFRTYRLALACTGEYYQFHGTTDAEVLSEMNTSINRVNQVMELDMAVRLILIANNDLLLYDNPVTDPYTNNSGSTMLGENQTEIDATIGTANYDIGHVYSTGGGGIASLGSICFNNAKARGVTGLPNPINDPFYIDFVAHELGHQFGGNHTFNSTEFNCAARAAVVAYEPGSGTTIQAYAGICGPTANVQLNSDAYYHIASLEEFAANFADLESFNIDCDGTVIGLNNNPPSVDAGPNYTIPKQTPFVLSPASSSDPDGDPLTFCWEQYDLGNVEAGIPSGNLTSGPLFRSLPPSSSPERYIDGTDSWEVLSNVARNINFQVTVRDQNLTFGCTVADNMMLTVVNVGPFSVTTPNGGEEALANSPYTVEWDAAGTNAAPINCSNVDIEISLDGGESYTTLLTNTPNDGSQEVTLPDVAENDARIRIICSDNIFYDFSDANFTIVREDFTITTANTETTICQPVNTANYQFNLNSLLGYTGTVNLTAIGLPFGVSATFTPSAAINLTANQTQSVDLQLSNTGGLAAGTYSFTVNGNDGTRTKSLDFILIIDAQASQAPTLISPSDNGILLLDMQQFSWQSVPGADSYYWERTTAQFFWASAHFPVV